MTQHEAGTEEKTEVAQQNTRQSPQSIANHKNESVDFEVLQHPACLIEYKVTASASIVADAKKKALKEVSKQISMPGFRKGKAPDELVLKKYPQDIEKRMKDEIANLSFRECQKISRIPPLNNDAKVSFQIENFNENGTKLSLQFETEPFVPTIDPKLFHLKPVKRPEVSEEKLEETLRQTQLFFAQWTPVEDRGVAEKDFVRLDVVSLEDSTQEPLFENTRFEVAAKSMAKWMSDLILGKHIGDELEGISVPDEDASQEDKENLQPKKVLVRILAIETPEMPEVNDDFARSMGADSVEEMKSRLMDLLETQANEHVIEVKRNQASEFLLAQYPIDLPHSLIEREAHFRMKQMLADQEALSSWKKMNAEGQRQLYQNIITQSAKAVRMFYLCRAIIKEARINISPRDVPQAADTPLENFVNPRQEHMHDHGEMRQAEVFSRLILEKAEDYLIENSSQA